MSTCEKADIKPEGSKMKMSSKTYPLPLCPNPFRIKVFGHFFIINIFRLINIMFFVAPYFSSCMGWTRQRLFFFYYLLFTK